MHQIKQTEQCIGSNRYLQNTPFKRSIIHILSSVHGKFSRIDHIQGHKKSLSKFKKIEILPTNLSDHKGIKLEINSTKKTKRLTNTWRLNNMLLKNQWINDQIKIEIKQYMKTNENNIRKPQLLWDTAEAVLRGKYMQSRLI